MANIRGKGLVQDLIVSWKDSQVKGPVVYATAQIDQSHVTQKSVKEGKTKVDTNPYLVSVEKENNGQQFVDHTFKYSAKQIEAMKDAGQFESKDGMNAITVKASLMPVAQGKGLMINTAKPMGPSDNKWTPIYALNKQAKLTAVAKEHAKLERESTKSANVEAQAENEAQADNQSPDFA